MAKRSRSRTKRRGGAIADYLPSWLGGTPAAAPAASAMPPQLPQDAPLVPPGVAAEPAGMNTLGGRRRRSRKTKRRSRRGGKYY